MTYNSLIHNSASKKGVLKEKEYKKLKILILWGNSREE